MWTGIYFRAGMRLDHGLGRAGLVGQPRIGEWKFLEADAARRRLPLLSPA
jgi:hypothetical protein